MPIPYVLATIALIWGIARRLAGPGAAVLAALAYAVASTDPYLFGNGANMEHFINLFAVASLYCMVRALSRPGRVDAIVSLPTPPHPDPPPQGGRETITP